MLIRYLFDKDSTGLENMAKKEIQQNTTSNKDTDENISMDKSKIESEPEKQSLWNSFFSFENIKSLGILILIVFAIRWSIISPYKVPTSSMEPTIKVGDRLMANKLAFKFTFPFTRWVLVQWSTPKRGDVIVFRFPKDPSLDFVKRVVGVAGDEILIKDNVLYVNGTPQEKVLKNSEEDRKILEDILDNKDSKILYQEQIGQARPWIIQNSSLNQREDQINWPINGIPYKVEEDSVFVMGDNRDNSSDSRSWGEVPMSYVIGKAMFVIFSKYKPEGASYEWTFRWNRVGHIIK